jgi:hypothetical protein
LDSHHVLALNDGQEEMFCNDGRQPLTSNILSYMVSLMALHNRARITKASTSYAGIFDLQDRQYLPFKKKRAKLHKSYRRAYHSDYARRLHHECRNRQAASLDLLFTKTKVVQKLKGIPLDIDADSQAPAVWR